MVFWSRVNSSGRSGADTRRHGRIRFYQAFISRPFRGPSSRWCLESQWPLQISPLVAVTSRPRDRSFVTGDTRNQRKDAFSSGSSKFFCWVDVEVALPRGKTLSSCGLLRVCVRIHEYLKVRNSPCISSQHSFFFSIQSHIFKFYSIEMMDDVYEILLHFMDFYLQNTDSWGNRWRFSYILAVSWEA